MRLYRFNDTLISILSGTVQTAVGIVVKPLSTVAYHYVYENHRLVTISNNESLPLYAALFLLIDLQYYWFHRLSHEFHLMWGPHSVHHSGEDYNVATALRQGAFQTVFSDVLKLWFALWAPPVSPSPLVRIVIISFSATLG